MKNQTLVGVGPNLPPSVLPIADRLRGSVLTKLRSVEVIIQEFETGKHYELTQQQKKADAD